MSLAIQPPPHYVRLGAGLYSEVYRRPGSPFVMQLFKTERGELTPAILRAEYAYLRRVFTTQPDLIPRQWVIPLREAEDIGTTVVVKEFVAVDTARSLRAACPAAIGHRALGQLEQFLATVRELLVDTDRHLLAPHQVSAVPDFIDPDMANLVVDDSGTLRLLDTNRLINSRVLRNVERSDTTLDVHRRRIHALLFRRMMFLEHRFLGRSVAALRADPLYRRFLTVDDIDAVMLDSDRVGEPFEPGPSAPAA
ncbi:hypothetical protein GCM10022247_35900 [Allokutzneria multivorans]|uniref:Uncharacterized protein n=1 Tax=Allokutzneria multivorans TaxID=1142134 RepID=A0ABP7SE13_9PSEU